MKKGKIFFVLIVVLVLLNSCSNNESKHDTTTVPAKIAKADTSKFPLSMVDNKRDPSCGMPMTAGIGDTAHYKNKIIGFCSKECKDEFLKDPEKNISAAHMK